MSYDEVDHDAKHETLQTEPQNPLDGIPDLQNEIATDEKDIVAGLKLVADSVAQQRQVASRILIFHPLNIGIYTILLAMIAQYFYKVPSDLAIILTTGAGLTMVALVTVRWLTGGYLFEAEEINWDWLGDDQILITKFGDEVIASLVLGWEKGEGRGNRRKKWGRGVIRGWAVRLRYRGKGVGTELLEEAVRNVERRGGEEIVFADDHANHKRILKPFYNAPMDRKENKYRAQLEDIVAKQANFGRKR